MKHSSKRYKELTKKVEKILYSPEEAVNILKNTSTAKKAL